MEIEIIRTKEGLIKIANEWDKLNDIVNFSIPFLSWSWYQIWLECFENKSELYVIAVLSPDGKILALAPFMKTNEILKGVNINVIRFIYNSIGPRNCIYYHNSESGITGIRLVFECLRQHKHEWDMVYLENIPQTTSSIPLLDQLSSLANIEHIVTAGRNSPFIEIKNSFNSYLEGHFNSKHRSDIRRGLKSIASKGRVEIKKYITPKELKRAIKIAFEISLLSWKGARGSDMGANSERRKFYELMTAHFSQHEKIRVYILFLNDVAIAFQYQMVSNGVTYLLINDFDERQRKNSPGAVLLFYVIEDCYKQGEIMFDFCGDAYAYKKRWATGEMQHLNLQIFNLRPRSYFIFLMKSKVLPIFRQLELFLKKAGM
jgi:CelD/BcsL family acetyltransferase involved in cellulose biosynthesis